jgi:Fur family ferric uptake transcriptional regulator
VTPQRLIVLDAVCALEGHATISAIQEKVAYLDPSINRSTVYRALEVLQEAGLVTESDLGTGKVYKIAGEANHHHLSCKACGRIQTIPSEALDTFIQQIEVNYGFKLVADHLALSGFCADCMAKKKMISDIGADSLRE